MKEKPSITALIASFGRIYHAENDSPIIFNDTLSRQLMTNDEYLKISGYLLGGIDFFAPDAKNEFKSDEATLKWIVQTQIAPTPLARAKFCEDALKTALLSCTTQYVILGAGMDTFAFRNPHLLENLHVFEVDHPLTQQDKIKRIQRAGWSIPEQLHFVTMDFTTESLEEKLASCGFDKNKKTFFSWLGVSYYLTIDQIDHLLGAISAFSAEGSSLLFDFAKETLFTSPVKRVQNMMAIAAAGGEPMKASFSYDQLEQLLEKHHFLLYEHLTTEAIQQQYFYGRTDDLKAFEHIEYALAVLK